MTHDEFDLIIMGQIIANCHLVTSVDTSGMIKERNVMRYCHQGVAVCKRTFLFIHNIGLKRFKNIKASYQSWTSSQSARQQG